MSKIICEICGTAYPETAESCPICGYSQDLGLDEMVEEDIQVDVPITPKAKVSRVGAAAGKKNREIFDYDEVNPDEEMEDEEDSYDEEDEEEEEEESRSNPILVVILVVLIVLLLAAAGFIFFKFFLPNMGTDETVPVATTTAPVVTETEEATTEAPTIPCTKLALVGGLDVLAVEGQNFLLDVQVMPEDTTDKLIFISAQGVKRMFFTRMSFFVTRSSNFLRPQVSDRLKVHGFFSHSGALYLVNVNRLCESERIRHRQRSV